MLSLCKIIAQNPVPEAPGDATQFYSDVPQVYFYNRQLWHEFKALVFRGKQGP